MTHPSDDQLLLHSYGELPDEARTGLDAHLASCDECAARFRRLEESRVAIEWGLEKRPASRGRKLAWLTLPIAAGIAAVLLLRLGVPDRLTVRPPDRPAWQSHLVGSPNAGYVTGSAVISIDSQLTQLEQRSVHEPPRN